MLHEEVIIDYKILSSGIENYLLPHQANSVIQTHLVIPHVITVALSLLLQHSTIT